MSVELIKYAFTAGEISPTLFGRSDLTKYDLGLALAYNWFVDYRGGLSTRPGTEFVDFIPQEDKDTKMFTFRFSPELADNYVLLFGNNFMMPIQNGGYILGESWELTPVLGGDEGWFNISSSTTLGLGAWFKLNGGADNPEYTGGTFELVEKTGATLIRLLDVATLAPVITSTASPSSITASLIYKLPSPYSSEDLANLSLFQIRDTCRMTHPEHPIRNLVRNGPTSWEITDETVGNILPAVTGLEATPSGTGPSSFVFAVTQIASDGQESIQSLPKQVTNSVNYTTEAGSCKLSWGLQGDAASYNIYRSPFVGTGFAASYGSLLGYLGNVKGTEFIDTNIIPDYTKTPPQSRNPFAGGRITSIDVLTVGSGYSGAVTLSATIGTGFSGYAVVNSEGKIVNAVVLREGSGYTDATVITAAGGTGATFKVHVSPLTRNYPSISAIFQQRQVYAASFASPLTLWASQVGRYDIFDESAVLVNSDSYEFEIDSAEISPIKHMFSMRGGLLLLSQSGVWMLTGGGQQAVTPSNALADPQSYTGVSDVVPLKIGPDLLYVEGKGYSVRLLSYNDYSKIYSGEDKSVLSNHLFGPGKRVTKWAFAENPHKMVWGVREDGAIVNLTIVKEQEVFGWTWGQTKGLFQDIVAVQENEFDRCYVTTMRFINNRWRRYVEQIAQRDFNNIEDAWCVDSGMKLDGAVTAPDQVLEVSPEFVDPADGITKVTLEVTPPIFNSAFVGRVIRACGGIFRVGEFVNSSTIKANVISSATDLIPQDPLKLVIPAAGGEWSIGVPVTTLRGLRHLEGEMVSILGDGNVMPPQKVVNGAITLPQPVTKAIIGLAYECIAQTLPPTTTQATIEAKRKRIVGIGVRLHESRGLEYGRSLNEMYDMRERTNELLGTPTLVFNGIRYVVPSTDWDEDCQTYFQQTNPLPSTILGLVPDLELGDDTN